MKTDIGTFMIASRLILLRMRNVSNKSCRENQNTHFVFNQVFFPENRIFYEIMRKKYGRFRQATDDTIIRRMRFACRITTATDTHSEYVIILLHGNNGCANVPQCYLCMYIGCICIRSLNQPYTHTHTHVSVQIPYAILREYLCQV